MMLNLTYLSIIMVVVIAIVLLLATTVGSIRIFDPVGEEVRLVEDTQSLKEKVGIRCGRNLAGGRELWSYNIIMEDVGLSREKEENLVPVFLFKGKAKSGGETYDFSDTGTRKSISSGTLSSAQAPSRVGPSSAESFVLAFMEDSEQCTRLVKEGTTIEEFTERCSNLLVSSLPFVSECKTGKGLIDGKLLLVDPLPVLENNKIVEGICSVQATIENTGEEDWVRDIRNGEVIAFLFCNNEKGKSIVVPHRLYTPKGDTTTPIFSTANDVTGALQKARCEVREANYRVELWKQCRIIGAGGLRENTENPDTGQAPCLNEDAKRLGLVEFSCPIR